METNTVVKGRGACKGVVEGRIHMVGTPEEAEFVTADEILATNMTTPDMIMAMSRCKGWVTKLGGITCHAAITAREFQKPCVVGLGESFSFVQHGQLVRIDGATGVVELL